MLHCCNVVMVKCCKSAMLQSYKVTKWHYCNIVILQCCNVAKFHYCNVPKLLICNVAKLQCWKVAKLQGCNVGNLQSCNGSSDLRKTTRRRLRSVQRNQRNTLIDTPTNLKNLIATGVRFLDGSPPVDLKIPPDSESVGKNLCNIEFCRLRKNGYCIFKCTIL